MGGPDRASSASTTRPTSTCSPPRRCATWTRRWRRPPRSPAPAPLRTLFTVTFPLIAPAIMSGMLLSFIVMLGIYGIPAVLGAPGDIPVLTTYIFKLTDWSPPLYSTAAVGRDHPDGGHRLPGLAAAAGASRAQLHHRRRQGVPPARAQSRAVALVHARPRGRLPVRRRGAADAGADRRRVPQVPVHPQRRQPVRHEAVSARSTSSGCSTIRSPCARSGTRWRSA